jgi:exodeoxyribonuclease V gamma subunit
MHPVSADFRLYHGNDLEMLAGLLAAELAKPALGAGLLEPETILIPQPAMRRWLQKTLAECHGIAANLRFLTPGEFVGRLLDANLPGEEAASADTAMLRWRLWAVLSDPVAMRAPVFAVLKRALGPSDRGFVAWTLAGALAGAFEKYQAWRRDWLRRWDRGADSGDWQAELWRRATQGSSHRGARLGAYFSRLEEPAFAPRGLPPRVFAFACQNVSPDTLRAVASAARSACLHYYFLSPVAGWWGDLRTARERLRDTSETVFDDDETPLLRANGAAGRDFVRTLFSYEIAHPSFEQALYVAPDPNLRTGLLHRLQRDLLTRSPPPDPGEPSLSEFEQAEQAERLRQDRSLQAHSCHTRLREVQVLHDRLRDLLERDPNLQPREIAVLAPDIDAYAPYVHAVFGGAAHRIPYALNDLSALTEQPLVAAFLRLLALPTSRMTSNEALELLGLPAIAQRFGLASADFDALRAWLREAGVRWGLDAEHRQALGAPAEHAYTWAWALDRLLLGYASGEDRSIGDVAPWPGLEGSALTRLNALLQGLRALMRWRNQFADEHTAEHWSSLLAQMLEDFFPENPVESGDRRALEYLRSQIGAFARQTLGAGIERPLSAALVRAWFEEALAQADAGQPVLAGGVAFGCMVPMRLIPFKAICLLGMNDGDYPRRDPPGSLNRLSAQLGTPERRVGDRSIRDDDRLLFLQLFAAASEVFYLSYLGRNPRSGETSPPSAVVSELLDVAAGYFADAGRARTQLTVEHPLQPFAAEAFGKGDPRRASYQENWCPAAQMGDVARMPLPPFVPIPLAARIDPAANTRLVSRDALYSALANPSKAFLRDRLDLRLPVPDERLSETEPFDRNDGLRRYALIQRVFEALVGGEAGSREVFFRRLLAEGRIAPGASGIEEAGAMIVALAGPAKRWSEWASGAAAIAPPYEISLGEFVLTGRLRNVNDIGLLQFSASRGHGKTQLSLGIDALVWSALGDARPIHRLVFNGPLLPMRSAIVQPLPPDAARAKLEQLLGFYHETGAEPLPFMPKTGYAYVENILGGIPEIHAWKKAGGEWRNKRGHSEGQDPWVRLALRGHDPFSDFDSAGAERFRFLAKTIFSDMPGIELESASDA